MHKRRPDSNNKRASSPDAALEVVVEDLAADMPISLAELQAIERLLGDDWRTLLEL